MNRILPVLESIKDGIGFNLNHMQLRVNKMAMVDLYPH
jgi:hypothetical protein